MVAPNVSCASILKIQKKRTKVTPPTDRSHVSSEIVPLSTVVTSVMARKQAQEPFPKSVHPLAAQLSGPDSQASLHLSVDETKDAFSGKEALPAKDTPRVGVEH